MPIHLTGAHCCPPPPRVPRCTRPRRARACRRRRRADGPPRLPAARRRGTHDHVLAHALLRLEPRRGRAPLRVPGLDVEPLPRQRHRPRGRRADEPRRRDPALPPVDDRQPVFPVRTRPRRARRFGVALEQAVRLQHALVDAADADRDGARPAPLDAGRGRHGLHGLVPLPRRLEQAVHRLHERRRPARVVRLPPGRVVLRAGQVAHPRGAARVRPARERAPRRHVRPVEPDLHDEEPRVHDRRARRSAARSPTRTRRRATRTRTS